MNLRERWYDPVNGTWLTPDPAGYTDSSNLYAGFANDPVNNIDPTGEAVETVWDAISLGIGGVSLYHNVRHGNWGAAGLDAVGIVVDTAAVLTPFVPGGAGAALKASRATGLLAKAQLIDQTTNVGQGVIQAADEYSRGNLGWGTFYGSMSALGVRGMDASQFRFFRRAGYTPEAAAIPGAYRLSNRSMDTLVVGTLDDTAVVADWTGHQRLWVNDWSLTANAAWVRGGVDRNALFYLASPQNTNTLVSPRFGRTVFWRELQQLRRSGYVELDSHLIR